MIYSNSFFSLFITNSILYDAEWNNMKKYDYKSLNKYNNDKKIEVLY